jgi:hypothetical protein
MRLSMTGADSSHNRLICGRTYHRGQVLTLRAESAFGVSRSDCSIPARSLTVAMVGGSWGQDNGFGGKHAHGGDAGARKRMPCRCSRSVARDAYGERNVPVLALIRPFGSWNSRCAQRDVKANTQPRSPGGTIRCPDGCGIYHGALPRGIPHRFSRTLPWL